MFSLNVNHANPHAASFLSWMASILYFLVFTEVKLANYGECLSSNNIS